MESSETIDYIDYLTQSFNKINKNKQKVINKVKMDFINSSIYKKRKNESNK